MTVLCVSCGRGVRPKRTLAADYPGLLCAGNRGECSACTTKRVRIARDERILMSANVGRPSPTFYSAEPPVRECCLKCRRGTRAFGVLPCGYALNCKCHRREP